MSERSVTVKMGADVGQYKRAMGEAQSATKKFADDSGRSIESVSVKMGKVGKDMTTKVTLPLLAVGAGALKLSMDFDASMSKITALVGLGADEVAGMRDSVLELAGSTATAPQELSEALFVLTSAGLSGDDALSALEASAKASAAGLGQTNDIARAVAGAMNAYGPGALDAARATDILTATARAGNFETSQLAGALGRVLPFAKQAGASFEDVGGAVALLTRTNGNAAESITQVQALMRSFVVPTAEAATILGELGLTAEDVRTSIGENGLVATLQMLDGKLGGNREQLGRLIGSSEGASAAFQVLDADADSIAGTFGTVTDSVGMTDEAFGTMAETGAFELKQAWVDIQTALIEVGGVIGPVVADIAGGISDLAAVFADLSPGAQTAIIVLGGIVAAAGPVLVITSKLVTSFIALKAAMAGTSFAGTGAQIAAMAGPLGVLAVAVGAVGYGWATMGANQRERVAELRQITQLNLAQTAQDMEDLAAAAQALGDPVAATAGRLRELAMESPELSAALAGVDMSIEDLAASMVAGRNGFAVGGEALRTYTDSAGNTKTISAELADELLATGRQALTVGRNFEDMAGVSDEVASSAEAQAEAVDGGTEAMEGHAEATQTAREQLEEILAAQAEFTAAVLDSIASTFDHEKATIALADASADLAAKTHETALIQLDSKRTDEEKAQALRDLRGEQIGVIEQALKTADAYSEEMGASVGSAAQVQNQIDALIDLAAQHPELQGEIDTTIDRMLAVPGTVDSRIDVETAEANRRIDETARRLSVLNGRVARTFVTNTVTNISVQEYRTIGAPNRAGQNNAGFSEGGYIGQYLASASLAEDGAEAVLPLTKPNRMVALLSDPRISGPVIAAMAGMASRAMPATPAAATSAPAPAGLPDPDRWGARAADSFSRRLQHTGRAA